MTIDFHSIPGMSSLHSSFVYSHSTPLVATSVAVERTFSRGRILLSHLRNRLRNATVRALMCFGDWSRNGMLDDSEMAQRIEGSTRKAAKEKSEKQKGDDDDVDDTLVDDAIYL